MLVLIAFRLLAFVPTLIAASIVLFIAINVLRGDFGNSFQNHVPVGPELLARLPVTLELAALAFLIANLIAVPLGALAAYFHQRTADVSITFMATVMGAIPNFWLATLLILLFSLTLRWLPAGGYVPFFDDPVRN